ADPLFPPVKHSPGNEAFSGARPLAPVFALGDKALLTVVADDLVGHWSAEDGRRLRTGRFFSPGSTAMIYRIEAAPGGRLVAVGGFSGARVWDVEKFQVAGAFMPHANHVTAMAFHPDGKTLLTVSEDRKGRLWTVADGATGGQPVGPPLPHQAGVTLAAWSPDGLLLATAQNDGLVRVWRPQPGNPHDRRIGLPGMPSMAPLSPDPPR